MSDNWYMLTLIGEDKPGMVAAVTVIGNSTAAQGEQLRLVVIVVHIRLIIVLTSRSLICG